MPILFRHGFLRNLRNLGFQVTRLARIHAISRKNSCQMLFTGVEKADARDRTGSACCRSGRNFKNRSKKECSSLITRIISSASLLWLIAAGALMIMLCCATAAAAGSPNYHLNAMGTRLQTHPTATADMPANRRMRRMLHGAGGEDRIPTSPENIFRWQGETPAAEQAADHVTVMPASRSSAPDTAEHPIFRFLSWFPRPIVFPLQARDVTGHSPSKEMYAFKRATSAVVHSGRCFTDQSRSRRQLPTQRSATPFCHATEGNMVYAWTECQSSSTNIR